ncbi:MAG: PAS/PAC sensor signal transduction histidine kinase [Ignavibacteria bacterium]|nr:MAG: PAS/PAC sensor signal transduction histidine kinase [Ignavibacteria bacterium]KAF0156903.1 MAG: PAS/PAC sensor signal transduction histidine kinase [Ignavibacteria bacterium]
MKYFKTKVFRGAPKIEFGNGFTLRLFFWDKEDYFCQSLSFSNDGISLISIDEQIINALGDPQNPVYVALLTVLVLFGTIYFFYKYGISPLNEKFRKEKESIELKSAKMMALFAELDPDPVIRINQYGKILETNKAAHSVFSDSQLMGKNINELLPELVIRENFSIKNETRTINQKIGKKHYSILYRGDANISLAQLYFRDISELKKYEEALLNYQRKLKNLSDRLHDIIEDERKRISYGLHDGIGQSLSLLRIKLLKLHEESKTEEHSSYYEGLVLNLEEIIYELKEITYSLKPKLLSETGLFLAVKSLIDKAGNDSGIIGDINVSGKEVRLEEKLEISLFRIAQESLNNILKHSKASKYSVQLIYSPKVFRLIISDNGIGFDVNIVMKNNSSGMGLLSIRERIESYNGIFKIESLINKGTMLVAEVPLSKEIKWHLQDQYTS